MVKMKRMRYDVDCNKPYSCPIPAPNPALALSLTMLLTLPKTLRLIYSHVIYPPLISTQSELDVRKDLTPAQLGAITDEEIETLRTRNNAGKANLLKHLLVKAWGTEERSKLAAAGEEKKNIDSMRFVLGRLSGVLNPDGSNMTMSGTGANNLAAVYKEPQPNKHVTDTM
jgi:hypothetical protein